MSEFREPHSFELARGPLFVGGIALDIAADGSASGARFAATL
jgi:hypothetical protein